MDWLYYILLLLVAFVGLFINILGLPGLWLIVGAAGIYWLITGVGVYFGWTTVIALIILALMAEVVEFLAGAAGTKSAGGSKRGMAGAITGGVLGGIFLTALVPIPIVGTIIGACLGCFIGALVVELPVQRNLGNSVRIGIGAAKGRLYGMASKLAFGVIMLLLLIWMALPVGGATPPPATPVATPPATVPASMPAP
jgi:uncharacterized protein YqgC (DUF456 family)